MARTTGSRLTSALTALLFTAWTCGPGVPAAWAATGVTIAVVGVHGNGEQDDDLLRALGDDLVRGFADAGLEVRSGQAVGTMLEPERDRLLERVYLSPVTRAFDEGRVLYEKAQPDQAIEALERAQAALLESDEFLRDARLRVDVPLYLGLSWFALGEGARAEPAFAEVVRADPARVLDSLDYPPNIVETFDRVRGELLAEELGSIAIEAPGNARVFVDGRLVGTAPAQVDGLPAGRHTLLVDGGTAGRWFEALELEPGESVEREADLQRRGLARASGDPVLPARSGTTRRLYRELATTSGVDAVAVAGFDEAGDFRLALYSARSDTFSVAVDASLAAAPGARSKYVKDLAGRVAQYVDEAGGVKAERVATEAIPLRLGGNPVLNQLLQGPEPGAAPVASTAPAASADPAPAARKGPHPGGIVALIVGGLLAGAGAGVGVYFATRPAPVDPGGALVIEFP